MIRPGETLVKSEDEKAKKIAKGEVWELREFEEKNRKRSKHCVDIFLFSLFLFYGVFLFKVIYSWFVEQEKDWRNCN